MNGSKGNPDNDIPLGENDGLQVRKQRSKSRPLSTQRLSAAKSLSLLSPTVEENFKESEIETRSETPPVRKKSNASGSSNKENRPPPDDVLKGQYSPPHSAPESACSASKEKLTTIHSQPIDHLKFMEPNLSLMTGIPMETPKRLRGPIKETTSQFEKGKAGERVSRQSAPSIDSAKGNPAAQLPRTLLKPLSPSPPPENNLRGIGSAVWAKKSLSKDSLGSQETAAPPSSQRKLKVLISRASTREPEPEMPKDQRRLRGSDPGMRVKVLDRSPRKVSRSLYDDPQRKKNLLELDYAKKFPRKDPLSIISQEEDTASLAELAQALSFLEEQDGANSPSTVDSVKEPSSTFRPQEQTTVFERTARTSTAKNLEQGNRPSQVGNPKTSQLTMNEITKVDEKSNRTSGLSQKSQATSSDTMGGSTSAPKWILTSTNPVTPKSQTNQQRTPVGNSSTKRAASPSTKFSALVARFNNPDSQTTPERSPSRPPKKSLAEFLAGDNQKRADSPGDGLVAPYTTNPPSPTKSQKSGKSPITPQSRRSSLISSRKLLFDATLDFSRRGSTAGKDDLSLRVANTSPEDVASSKQSPPTTKPSPFGCRKSPCPLEDISPTEANPPNPLNEDTECEAGKEVQDERSSSVDCSNITSPDHVIEHVTVCAMKIPASFLSPISSEGADESPPMVSAEVATFDGPSGALNLNKLPRTFGSSEAELNRTKSSLSLVEKATFVHPDSPFKGIFTTSHPVSPVGSPPLPGRSNSVLYAQIRTLQRQLARKSEEVRHLKNQLDTRSSLDIGTLSEQLREAKKEIQHWKSRAEVAEKQVDMFANLPLKPKSRQPSRELSTKSSRRVFERSSTADAGYPGEAADMAARVRKALHGMDGASSPPCWSSEESSDTVIREPINGSDQSV